MCTYSMVMDWGQKKLQPYKWEPVVPIEVYPSIPTITTPGTNPTVNPFVPTDAWRKQFLKDLVELLRDAKKYDEDNGEPDCELDSKKEKLKAIADELGVEISFP